MFHPIDTFVVNGRVTAIAPNPGVYSDMTLGRSLLMASLLGALSTAASAAPESLPNRVLTCDVGHVTNFDAGKSQTPAELKFDSRHRFVFALAGGPARTAPPPDASKAPEKVRIGSRILSDPDHIAPQRKAQFDQVVDYWPDRVEAMGFIKDQLRNAIVISGIDPAAGTANLFMLRATELTRFDPGHIYQGTCRISFPRSR